MSRKGPRAQIVPEFRSNSHRLKRNHVPFETSRPPMGLLAGHPRFRNNLFWGCKPTPFFVKSLLFSWSNHQCWLRHQDLLSQKRILQPPKDCNLWRPLGRMVAASLWEESGLKMGYPKPVFDHQFHFGHISPIFPWLSIMSHQISSPDPDKMASQYPQPMNFCNLLQVKLMFAAAMPWQTHRCHLVKWQVCNKIPGQTSKVEDPNHQSWLG